MATERRQLRRIPLTRRVALAAVFIALGVALGAISFPVGPARVAPFQHMINVLTGVMLGPLDAPLVALAISILRNALGTGTILAFPGSIFGAFIVGFVYRYLWHSDYAAWTEIIGTSLIGAAVGYLLLVGLNRPTPVLGLMSAKPLSPFAFHAFGLAFSFPPGLLALIAAFAVSDIPGVILGFLVLRALRRAGVVME